MALAALSLAGVLAIGQLLWQRSGLRQERAVPATAAFLPVQDSQRQAGQLFAAAGRAIIERLRAAELAVQARQPALALSWLDAAEQLLAELAQASSLATTGEGASARRLKPAHLTAAVAAAEARAALNAADWPATMMFLHAALDALRPGEPRIDREVEAPEE